MPSPLAARLLGEAFDPGDYPDYMDRRRRQKLERGETALRGHPAMSTERGTSMASRAYQALMAKIARYTGIDVRNQRQTAQLPAAMMQLLRQATSIERAHKAELQDLVNRAAVYKNALEYYENLSYSCGDLDLGGHFYEGEIAKIALSEGEPKALMAKIEAEIIRKNVEE